MIRRALLALGLLLIAGTARAGTTWDSVNSCTNFTYNTPKLVATHTLGSGNADVVIGTPLLPASKVYFEITNSTTGNNDGFGVADASINSSNACGIASTAHLAYGFQGGALGIFVNGSQINSTWNPGAGAAATIGVAVDVPNKKMWLTANGTTWNGNSDNPGTNTGGVSISGLTGSNFFPMAGLKGNGATETLNVGGSAFAYTVPSGYGAVNPASNGFLLMMGCCQ